LPRFIQLGVDSAPFNKATVVAEAFVKTLHSINNNHCSANVATFSQSSEFLYLAPVSNGDVCKAIEMLKPILERISNLRLTQQYFPTVWKETKVLPVYKKKIMPLSATIRLFIFSTIFPSYLNSLFTMAFRVTLN
jgi:hypothetical protein